MEEKEEEYIRKVPYFNDYNTKKDPLKYPPEKYNDEDVYEQTKIRDKKNNIEYIIKKRQDIKEIFNYDPDPNRRTQKDILGERKNQLKKELNNVYETYEKKNPFFVDTVVEKDPVTKTMKDVLTNKYVPYEEYRTRISDDVDTKSMLLEERKKQYLKELRQNKLEDDYQPVKKDVPLDAQYDFKDVVKNKNKSLTFKNFGFWYDPSDFVFSYPDIKAKSKGGWATDLVKAQIIDEKISPSEKKMNIKDISVIVEELQHKENIEKRRGIFLMKNRFQFIKYSKNHCSAENYYQEKPHIVLRHGGFQKWTS